MNRVDNESLFHDFAALVQTAETTMLLMQPQELAHRQRDGKIWRFRNHDGGISLDQVHSIITAAGIPLSGRDDQLDPHWIDELPWQACPLGSNYVYVTPSGIHLRKIVTRVAMPIAMSSWNLRPDGSIQVPERDFGIFAVEPFPPKACGQRVSAIEMLFAMHQLLEAYSEARSSLTGFADKKTVKWLRTASRRSRALARHLADSRDRFQIACSGPSFETFEKFLNKCEKYGDRFDFMAEQAAAATKTEKALLRFMDHLVPCFEYLFGEQATSGWNHRGSRSQPSIPRSTTGAKRRAQRRTKRRGGANVSISLCEAISSK
jgi:hypothetical protein